MVDLEQLKKDLEERHVECGKEVDAVCLLYLEARKLSDTLEKDVESLRHVLRSSDANGADRLSISHPFQLVLLENLTKSVKALDGARQQVSEANGLLLPLQREKARVHKGLATVKELVNNPIPQRKTG